MEIYGDVCVLAITRILGQRETKETRTVEPPGSQSQGIEHQAKEKPKRIKQ